VTGWHVSIIPIAPILEAYTRHSQPTNCTVRQLHVPLPREGESDRGRQQIPQKQAVYRNPQKKNGQEYRTLLQSSIRQGDSLQRKVQSYDDDCCYARPLGHFQQSDSYNDEEGTKCQNPRSSDRTDTPIMDTAGQHEHGHRRQEHEDSNDRYSSRASQEAESRPTVTPRQAPLFGSLLAILQSPE
jgi:hypothetical protein